jgi:hypothetical protein
MNNNNNNNNINNIDQNTQSQTQENTIGETGHERVQSGNIEEEAQNHTTATSLIFQFHIPNRSVLNTRSGESTEESTQDIHRQESQGVGQNEGNEENLRESTNPRRESYPVAIIFEFASPVPISLMSEFLLSINSGPNLLNFLRGRLFPPNASDDDILNLLFQQHQPQTPPSTSKQFIETCPIIPITNPESHDLCLVCQDHYQIGDEALKLPCQHLYHKESLLPWLKSRNTCPTCRYALPIDEDEDKSKFRSNLASINEENREGSESVPDRTD